MNCRLVGGPGRGPRFELIIARLRAKYPNIFFLGLAAAVQGANQLAQWLTDTDAIAGASRPREPWKLFGRQGEAYTTCGTAAFNCS